MTRRSARVRTVAKSKKNASCEDRTPHQGQPRKTPKRNPRRRKKKSNFVQLSPQNLGDVVAADAARAQQMPDKEPYLNFYWYLSRASMLDIAMVDPDHIRGSPEAVGEAWKDWIPTTSLGRHVAGREYVVAISPDQATGWPSGFKHVARHHEDGVVWPIPIVPGGIKGANWGFPAPQNVAERFAISDGVRRRSNAVSPSCIDDETQSWRTETAPEL